MVTQICSIFFIVMLKASPGHPQPSRCDRSWRGVDHEGILGSVDTFPWLGVLRVHLHNEEPLKIALTGIVLVKDKFAIGHADDIARIPKRVFKEDARAMFVAAPSGTPWFCRPVDYMTHPEYEVETLNTIAIIELTKPENAEFPVRSVCWPPYSYNTSTNLYVVGYTDEHQILEKFIHKLQYVQKDICKEFYNRAGLSEGIMTPVQYECGFAPNNQDSCVWDNGMALVSNSSGHWVLVGLGLQGPGCAAPARFVSLAHYYEWIESVTDLVQMDEEPFFRRSAFNEGFKRIKDIEYVPAHDLLRQSPKIDLSPPHNKTNVTTPVKKKVPVEKMDLAYYYPHEVLIHQEDPFHIERVSGTHIQITKSVSDKNETYLWAHHGNCNDSKLEVVYREIINMTTKDKEQMGIIQYRMTLHDSMFTNYTCIAIKALAQDAGSAYLYYDTILVDASYFPENPDDIIREYPFYNQTRLLKKGTAGHLTSAHIKTVGKNITAYNVNLYLKVVCEGNCSLEIVYVGLPAEPTMAKLNTTAKDPSTNNIRKYTPLEFVEDEAVRRELAFEKDALVAGDANSSETAKVCFWCVTSIIFFCKSYLS